MVCQERESKTEGAQREREERRKRRKVRGERRQEVEERDLFENSKDLQSRIHVPVWTIDVSESIMIKGSF